MIKAILFDADGVIIQTTELFSQRLNREYGISVERTRPFFSGAFQNCLIGKADLKKELVLYLAGWGWKKSVDEFMDYWFQSEHKIYEPLVEEIYTLRQRGIRCYLATNNEKYQTEYMLKIMGLLNVFDGVLSSSGLGHLKHHAKYYEQVFMQLHDVKQDEILLWDDNEKNIEMARQMGLHAELYTSFEDYREKMEAYLG